MRNSGWKQKDSHVNYTPHSVCLSTPAVPHSRWCDGTVALLSGRVPDLGLHCFAVHLDAACGKLHSNGALALQVELIAGEAGQQVTLPHAWVSNEDDWKTTFDTEG